MKRFRQVRLAILVSCGIALIFVDAFYFGFLRRIVATASYPLLVVQRYTVAPCVSLIQAMQKVYVDSTCLQQLEQRCYALQGELIRQRATQQFMTKHKELLAFQQRYEQSTQLCPILLKQLKEEDQSFLLGCGSASGVANNMVAIYNNVVIGKVVEVFPYYARALFITDKRCKIAACCSKTNATGIVQGLGKKNQLRLKYVSHLDVIKKDDLVLTSGEGTIFPAGFGIGKITRLSCSDVYYEAYLTPLVEFDTLQACLLIRANCPS